MTFSHHSHWSWAQHCWSLHFFRPIIDHDSVVFPLSSLNLKIRLIVVLEKTRQNFSGFSHTNTKHELFCRRNESSMKKTCNFRSMYTDTIFTKLAKTAFAQIMPKIHFRVYHRKKRKKIPPVLYSLVAKLFANFLHSILCTLQSTC